MTNIFLKISIGIFLLRIAVERTHRIILWTALIAIQLYSVFFFFIFTFQCWPIYYFWEQFRGGKGHCMPTSVVVGTFYGYSALSCVTDWIFSTVPIFIVQGLQMNQKKKVTVGFLLAFCAVYVILIPRRCPLTNISTVVQQQRLCVSPSSKV